MTVQSITAVGRLPGVGGLSTSGDTVGDIVVSVLMLVGAACVLTSAIAMVRERDALSRINVLSPATALGLPLIVVAGYINNVQTWGFDPVGLLQLLLNLAALWVVSSFGSNALARAAYLSGAPVDPRTAPQDLAREVVDEDAASGPTGA